MQHEVHEFLYYLPEKLGDNSHNVEPSSQSSDVPKSMRYSKIKASLSPIPFYI